MSSSGQPDTRGTPGRDPVTRNAVFALASQFATAAFTAILTLYLVRKLGPDGYGVFALAVGFSSLVLLPADFGITGSAARFIAERRDDPDAVAAVLVTALRLKLALTSCFAAVLVALADPIANLYDAPNLAWPLRVIAIALLGQSLMMLFMSTFVALGRVSIQFRLVLSESAIEATASIMLVALAGGVTAAAAGRAIGFVCGAVIGLALVLRLLGRGAFARRGGGLSGRSLAGYAGALLIIDGAFAVFSQVGVLLVGALLGAGQAGIYGAPTQLIGPLHYPGLAAAHAIAPRLARRGDSEPDTTSMMLGLRYLILLQAAVVGVIVVWADPIVELLLGPEYGQSADVLRALAPFAFMKGLGGLLTIGINYLGEARRRVPIAAGAVVVNLGLAYVLIKEIGVVGAAVSVDVSYAMYLGAHLWVLRSMLGLSLRPLFLSTARALLAAAVMSGVLAAFGTGDLAAVEWIGGLLAGAAAYVGSLFVLRELERGEIRWIVGRLRAGFPAT